MLKLQNGSIFLYLRNFCDSVQDVRGFFTLTIRCDTCTQIVLDKKRWNPNKSGPNWEKKNKSELFTIYMQLCSNAIKLIVAFCRLTDQVIVFHLDLFWRNCYNPVQDIRNSFSLSVRYAFNRQMTSTPTQRKTERPSHSRSPCCSAYMLPSQKRLWLFWLIKPSTLSYMEILLV